jgi:hypothetical protein
MGVEWIHPEVGALLMLLMMSAAFHHHLDNAPVTLAQYGYCIMDDEMFKAVVEARIAEARARMEQLTSSNKLPPSVNELLHVLEGCSGSTWPLLPGSPIRRDGKALCIDLYTATTRLHSILEFPHIQGEAANARANHFELAAQKVIDGSPWCPSETPRQLRGRALRYQKQDVTDIDAIGERGNILLMVSCKSVVYSSAYDTGEYATIRNTADLVAKAVAYWQTKSAFFAANPIGTNYDLTKYERLAHV